MKVVRSAIEHGADANISGDVPSLQISGLPSHFDDFCLYLRLKVHSYDEYWIFDYGIATPLILAAGSGRIDIARVLLQHDTSINHIEKDMTALMVAAQGGHTNMVELLLENDVEVTLRKSTNASDLAADGGHFSTLDVLLRHDADPDGYVEESLTHAQNLYDTDFDFNSYPTTIKAIKKGYVEVVQMLLDYGADIQVEDFQGETPLMYAIDNDDWDMVRLLLKSGVDPTEEHDMNGVRRYSVYSLIPEEEESE